MHTIIAATIVIISNILTGLCAVENYSMAIIKLSDEKYVEITLQSTDSYIRYVNKIEIYKISITSNEQISMCKSIVKTLITQQTELLGDTYPKTLIFVSENGKDYSYDLDSIATKTAIIEIDKILLRNNISTVKQFIDTQ